MRVTKMGISDWLTAIFRLSCGNLVRIWVQVSAAYPALWVMAISCDNKTVLEEQYQGCGNIGYAGHS